MARLSISETRRNLPFIFPSVLLMVLGVGAVVGILVSAAVRQDRADVAASSHVVEQALAREQRVLERRATDIASTAESLERLVRGLDPQGGEAAYLLDAGNGTVFSWDGGRSGIEPDAVAAFTGGLADLTANARGQGGWGQDGRAPAPISSFLKRGTDVVVAVATAVGSGPEGRVLVLTRRLDRTFLAELAALHGLGDLRMTEPDEEPRAAAHALTGIDGSRLAVMAWEPSLHGHRLLSEIMLPVSGGLLLMLALGFHAIYRSTSTATALSRSGRRLAESEARFRVFAETASDWLWETDSNHAYTFVSERLVEILGGRPEAGPEAGLGGTLRQLADLQRNAGDGGALHDTLAAGRPFRNVEVDVGLADGSRRILRISGQPCRDREGRFKGYRGTGVDITGQVSAGREAERIRDLLYDAVESISEGFVLFGADGRLVVCNERYRSAYPLLADCLVPGVTFTEVLRVAALRGGYQEAMSDLASWVAERLARHMQAGASTDHCLADGLWYRISERATRSGGVVKILTDITELKRHEEALAGKTALLQATFDNIAQGIVVSDSGNRLLAWNGNFLKVLGYPEELARPGEPMASFRGLDDQRGTAVTEVFSEVPATEDAPTVRRRVCEIVLPDGRVVETRESPMPGGGVVATYTDITERKRFERVLAELSQTVSRTKGNLFFHSLIGSLARALRVEVAYIGVLDDAGVIETVAVSVDGRVAHNFEYGPDASPGGDPRDHDVYFVPSRLGDEVADDSILGRWQAQTYMAKTLVDSANNPVGVIAVLARRPLEQPASARTLLDIFAVRAAAELERLQNETAIQDSEYRYRQLVELAPYGIVIWDGTRILFTNEAAARMFGSPSAAAMIGSSLGDRFRPYADEGFLVRLASPLASAWDGKPVEARALADSGELVDVEVSIFLFAHEGRAASLVMFNDITHRKRAEQALQHAHKMQAVGELAGGIAHEFNNMLTAIGGFAHMARRNPGDATRVDFCIGEIIKASDRATGLTAQLLSFSRRGLTENIKRFPVSTLMDDLGGFLRPVMGERVSVTFEVRVPDALLNADPSLLHQALVNLAINGRDAMAEVGGTIRIAADLAMATPALRDRHPELRESRYVAITVSDTGSGIEPDIVDRIFEPFFTTKEQGKGTGLGLPMVYSTVTRAGGAVEVTSKVGVGSSFTLYLPAEVTALSIEPDARSDSVEHPMEATVLLVEDEDQVRNYISMSLEDQGLSVVTAMDGLEAIDMIRSHGLAFDLVITDLVMPRAGGGDVARVLEQEAPDVPIIFMSGYAPGSQADGLMLENSGRRAFLGKPIDPNKLVKTIRDLLAG